MNPNLLTKDQRALLEAIGNTPALTERFYFTGGTPLAAFYLQHRYSEDLDFFSEQEIDVAMIDVFFQKHKRVLGITSIDFQQSFNRNLFFLTCNGEVLKTEFTYFPFKRIELGKPQFGIAVDSMLDIAVNKLFAIYQRTKARDYIDLYCLCREHGYTVDDLIKKARIKFDTYIDPLQLGTQFMRATEALDYPRVIRPLAPETWQEFFITEAKKLKPNILE